LYGTDVTNSHYIHTYRYIAAALHASLSAHTIHIYIVYVYGALGFNSWTKVLTRCCQPVQPHQVRSVYKRSSRSLGFSFSNADSYAPIPKWHVRRRILGASARRWIRGTHSRRRISEASAQRCPLEARTTTRWERLRHRIPRARTRRRPHEVRATVRWQRPRRRIPGARAR
jgi:hypothetical protein